MTKLPRPDLGALAICALALVGIILLAALGIPIPEVLTFVAFGALTGGTGIALNTPNGSETLRSSKSSLPAAAAAAPPLRAPAPRPAPVGAP